MEISTEPSIAGVIFTGGQSTRFVKDTGINKSYFTFNTQPAVLHSILLMSKITSKIYLSVHNKVQAQELNILLSENNMDKSGIKYIYDNTAIEYSGPLRAIISVIEAIEEDILVTMPVDYQYIRVQDLKKLIDSINQESCEIATYYQNNYLTSLLFALDVKLTKSWFAKLYRIKDPRVSALYRGCISCKFFIVNHLQSQFININYLSDVRQQENIQYIKPTESIIIRPGNLFWIFKSLIQNNNVEMDLVIKIGLKELKQWKIPIIRYHIIIDLKKIMEQDDFKELSLQQEFYELKNTLFG